MPRPDGPACPSACNRILEGLEVVLEGLIQVPLGVVQSAQVVVKAFLDDPGEGGNLGQTKQLLAGETAGLPPYPPLRGMVNS